MKALTALTTWLETRWVAPAYGGWLVLVLALFFFGAGTNTMAGWLYVLSGVMLAVLAINAVLAVQTLKGIAIERSPIEPVSVGESQTLALTLLNTTPRSKVLIHVQDLIPYVLGQPLETVIPFLDRQGRWQWVVEQPAQQRGIYRWHTIELRTAAPLGLFWCRRSQTVPTTAIVYPTVLPLSQCPLLDEMGVTQQPLFTSRDRNSTASNEGMTRSLRPYRWGDSTRMIHWRTSARYGNLQIRELETFTGGPEVVIALDSAATWSHECFEQAVIAAASLYMYAHHRGYNVSLWTAQSGLQTGRYPVLEVLADVQPQEMIEGSLPTQSCIWLSNHPSQTRSLPANSRWMLWDDPLSEFTTLQPVMDGGGLVIHADQDLLGQLQRSLVA